MSAILFSTWQGEFIDNRNKPNEEWSESGFKLPLEYDNSTPSRAFVGWDGVAIFDENIDAVKLAMEYAAQYQEYSEACGRCAPGRWGGRILYDLLDKIARGEGSFEDIDLFTLLENINSFDYEKDIFYDDVYLILKNDMLGHLLWKKQDW